MAIQLKLPFKISKIAKISRLRKFDISSQKSPFFSFETIHSQFHIPKKAIAKELRALAAHRNELSSKNVEKFHFFREN